MELHSYIDKDEDILLLNTIYVPMLHDDETNEWSDDVLYIVYRDNLTGIKKLKTIQRPKTEIFITKPEYRDEYKANRRYLEEYKVDGKIVEYNKITKYIMKHMQNDDTTDPDFIGICKETPKEAHKWMHAYWSDYNINDYIQIAYMLNHKLDETKVNVSKCFFDIETDIYGLSTTERDRCEGKINAISFVAPFDERGHEYKHPKVFTMLLRDHLRYGEQEYFEKHLDKFIKECHNEFDDRYNAPEFKIMMFDKEVDLLRVTFGILHKLSPDFILIWNMGFDVPTIIQRLLILGEDPRDYFCHPDFETPFLRYNEDRIYKNDFKNKSESLDCTSYSVWCDQMLQYAGVRKAFADYGGNSLDNVANIELGAEKRRYDDKTVTVINGAIKEYWNFVKYSINDVLLQYGIDGVTDDLQDLFERSLDNGTRLSKVMKQSVALRNEFAISYFKDENIVPGNNINVSYTTSKNQDIAMDKSDLLHDIRSYDDMSLPGAVVGDPTLNDYTGVVILGSPSNAFFALLVDFDYSSMYPNIESSVNIGHHTQVFRIIMSVQILKDENPDNNPKFIRGGKMIEDYETATWKFGEWHNLPNINDLSELYEKERMHR